MKTSRTAISKNPYTWPRATSPGTPCTGPWGDGKLDGETGPYPLSYVVLGGQQLYDGDDYILSLKDPKMVHDIAQALAGITKERLRAGYDAMDARTYGFEQSDEDFEYTWGWFEDVRTLYYTADRLGRHILFSVDQ